MPEWLGWAGAACYAVCSMPQAIQCAREGHARGLSWAFLILWLAGQTFTIIYIWPGDNTPLKANYMINYVFLAIMLRYKVKERK